jgi:hypothetical protein
MIGEILNDKIAKFFENRSDNALRNRWQLIARRRSKLPLPVVLPRRLLLVVPVLGEIPAAHSGAAVDSRKTGAWSGAAPEPESGVEDPYTV